MAIVVLSTTCLYAIETKNHSEPNASKATSEIKTFIITNHFKDGTHLTARHHMQSANQGGSHKAINHFIKKKSEQFQKKYNNKLSSAGKTERDVTGVTVTILEHNATLNISPNGKYHVSLSSPTNVRHIHKGTVPNISKVEADINNKLKFSGTSTSELASSYNAQ